MKRVLIVDDDRATSAGMADVVEEWGYEPELADTLKAGWNAVSKLVPDVAIVDLKLPDYQLVNLSAGVELENGLDIIAEENPASRTRPALSPT